MKEYFLETSKPGVKVSTKQKKKRKWVAETAYITAEGETESDALKALAGELRGLASSIEELFEEEES